MFGILLCCAPDAGEEPLSLKAFSGQYNGIWEIEGWVPPIPDPDAFASAVGKADPEIKRLTAEISRYSSDGAPAASAHQYEALITERRALSRNHMAEIHSMYRIRNFNGEESNLFSIFGTPPGKAYSVPAGTGDCCAPKLLNRAVQLGLKPLSMAEFFWGRTNRSGTKLHGHFYPPCKEKCAPLLGFMLRGSGLKLNASGDGFES